MISTRLVTGSMHFNVLIWNSVPLVVVIVQGPTQSTQTSSHGTTIAVLDGNLPKPWPVTLDALQFIGQTNCLQILSNPLL